MATLIAYQPEELIKDRYEYMLDIINTYLQRV